MSWVLTVLGIVALIVLHEFGHFIVAKATGMRVERFSLFFPPKIVGIRRGETEYMIGAIPAGGYVKITGMSPEEVEGLDPAVAARAYCNQPPWKRIVVILAGPGMNLLIAFLIFWAILVSGSLNGDLTLGDLNPSIKTLVPTTSVLAIERGKPADGVLKPGDRILAVDGRPATVTSAQREIAAHRCPGALTEAAARSRRSSYGPAGRKTLTLPGLSPLQPEAGGCYRVRVRRRARPLRRLRRGRGRRCTSVDATTGQSADGHGRALTSSKARKEVLPIMAERDRPRKPSLTAPATDW